MGTYRDVSHRELPIRRRRLHRVLVQPCDLLAPPMGHIFCVGRILELVIQESGRLGRPDENLGGIHGVALGLGLLAALLTNILQVLLVFVVAEDADDTDLGAKTAERLVYQHVNPFEGMIEVCSKLPGRDRIGMCAGEADGTSYR